MDDAHRTTTTYRLFRVSGAGRIAGPPDTLEAATDEEALRRAYDAARGRRVEVWDGARCVGTVAGVEPAGSPDPAPTG